MMSTAPKGLDALAQAFLRMAGFMDDPIAQTRVTWGALDGTSRHIKIEVVDRLDKRYPPTAFRNSKGKSPGRWVVMFYLADTEYGAPAATAVTYTVGQALFDIANVFVGFTDAAGVIEIDADKSGTEGWIHRAVIGLFRSDGIIWATGAPATGEAGDAPAGPGGSGPPVVEF
jgi:hypothetical protein